MKFRVMAGYCCWVIAFLLIPMTAFADQASKVIRLRNQQITTPGKGNSSKAARGDVVSGLFLIQFEGPLESAWRSELQRLGVSLLRFVPNDAFVVRCKQVVLSDVEALPFVRWVGWYGAEHKVYRSLPMDRAGGGAEVHEVRILLAPDATANQMTAVRGLMKRFDRESVTRFGRIFDGAVSGMQLQALANSDATLWIEPGAKMKLFDGISTKITAGDDGDPGSMAWVHQLGYDGSGVTVAVVDSGLQEGDADTMHPDLAGRVDAFFHYGTLADAADEHSHGTHVAGIIAGDGFTGEADPDGYLYGLGVAPGSHLVAQRIFDGDGAYHAPPSFTSMVRDAVEAGADIGSNSWGDDVQGRYDLTAAEFDALVRDGNNSVAGDQPFILEFSAGNAGPGVQTIGTPAVAKNVIASGATENDRFEFYVYDSGSETMADFSSRGPCEDGRIKPDVVAPGTWIASLRSSLANDENAWADISYNYLYQGGTSQSGPHVSGAAAVFVQFYRETVASTPPSPALVKAALINSAVDIDDGASTGPIPNNDEGWGRVDLVELIDSTRQYQFIDQSVVLTNGQVFEHRVLVASRDEPLRITLAYTDVPGFPATIPALVNDLDLEVIAPDGMVYRGNQFLDAESVPNAGSFDNINNVEGVHVLEPVPGEYMVRVRARSIPEDARMDTPATDQDFALVISADIPFPGAGVLFFNKGSYSAPAIAHLKLIDANLVGQSFVNVEVRSSTETVAEVLTLHADGPNGAFTNTIQTETGSPVSDGKLQIAHNDLIEAFYQDAMPSGIRSACARADLIAPVIANVAVTNRYGRTLVTWETDEPSDSIVRFGTNMVLSTGATNVQLRTSHELSLENLVVGATYQFYVSSGDEAGNRRTNNNNGAFFSFVAQEAAAVLLVDSYVDQFFSIPPLSGYTDALDQIGVSYEVWSVPTNGSPTIADLRQFQAVIWRVPEFDGTLSPEERATLTNYLGQGGSLLISSMEVLTRLQEVGGGTFVTNVLRVTGYTEDVGAPGVYGVDNDPITSAMDIVLDYAPYEDPWKELIGIQADISDTIILSPDASPILLEPSGRTVGARYPKVGQDSAGHVVFLSFPLDAVPLTGVAPDNRVNLLRNIVSFLVPGVNGIGTIALDRPAYSIPSQLVVEVADSDLAGSGQATVTLFSDTAQAGSVISLFETVRPGLFRGQVTLVGHTNTAAPGELRVQHGDLVWAEYFDASNGSVARSAAEIDSEPPVISGIQVTPEYEDAVIQWNTSKPADALVQFGESALLGRTAYDAEFNEEQFVIVTGLQADKTYYYRIVSRDIAGNVAVDDNNGALYTFRTLKPFDLPWSDNFENMGTNWLVIDGEPGTTWTLGTPNNGWENSAVSGVNAWGSNLDGQVIDAGDTSLIGPAISLVGGSRATLKFWHSADLVLYSDADIYEFGQVFISTNNGNAWIPLVAFEEYSTGWEEVEVDLTPFLGRVIRLGFYYGLFSLDTRVHPGWLIDDISVTVSDLNSGLIVITNNLSQAQFTLTGPVSRSGSGWITHITNAPLGTYVATFNPVAFYETPPPQTNILAAGSSLIFQGNYTFTDANANGISDAWESSYFGEVSPGRTAQTDTDGDSASDYAEFIAGTDPTNPTSRLQIIAITAQPDSNVHLEWTSMPGRAYQLTRSSNLLDWEVAVPWSTASAATTVVTLSAGNRSFFRIEVKP